MSKKQFLPTSSWSRRATGSIAALLMAISFTACGDSNGSSDAPANSGSVVQEDVYASEDDLPGCIKKFEGDVALVEKDSVAFKCEDGRWVNKGKYIATEENIKNCTEKREGEIAYIVDEDKSLVCQDGKWVKTEIALSSSNSRNDEKDASSPSSSSWNEVTGSSSSSRHSGLDPESSSSVKTPGSSSAEESSSSVASSSSIPFSYGVLNDDRDGKTYRTIKIGNLEWMAENLNFDPGQGGSGDEKYDWSWCYDNKLSNCEKYGRLYTWAAAVDSSAVFSENAAGCGDGKRCSIKFPVRGICPNGWHIPDAGVNGWRADEVCPNYADDTRKLQEKGIEAWPNATNEYGFSALPAGGYGNGSFKDIGRMAYFWGAPEANKELSLQVVVGDGNSSFGSKKSDAYSVRCVKD